MFSKPLLDIYRCAVVDKKSGTELRRIVKKVSDKGYLVNGKHYKKVPRSFDAEHPNAEFLLYNGLTARIEETISKAFFSDAMVSVLPVIWICCVSKGRFRLNWRTPVSTP